MGIKFEEKKQLFTLTTKNTSYQMMVDPYGFLLHIFYGERTEEDMSYLLDYRDSGFSGNPYDVGDRREYSLDTLPQEYPSNGIGDYRVNSVSVINGDGTDAVDFRYEGYQIIQGKYSIPGMPSIYGKEGETLIIRVKDQVTGLAADLYYSVWEEEDILTRCVKFVNEGTEKIILTKASSLNLDFLQGEWDLVHFHGRHCMERQMERVPVMHGRMTVGSVRGASSHHNNPFVILCDKETTEDWGDCYGLSLIYSGNFAIEIEKDQMNHVRMTAGIGTERFAWTLEEGEEFFTPEAVFTYSNRGFGKMSSSFHHIFREHLCRGKYKHERRPVLINNWEATYFDFDKEKILDIAKGAAQLGVELMVLDDGWFGKRDGDTSGLGDWFVNTEKLKGGLKPVADGVNALGMKFGLWFEPECISEDSDLYRAHPDWALQIPGRKPNRSRFQLILDMSREDVRDYLFERMTDILDSANIEYVKWDMNRQLSDLGSCGLPAERQGELSHRYMLAVYEMQERLTKEFPYLLLENCSGGGARFDAGMLYYSPQIWCSDDTDAIERLSIQEGTAMIYPLSAMGAHVSDCPNHTVGRKTPFETRGYVALAGTFGYELDVTKIPQEDRDMIPAQVGMYHKYNDLVRTGDYYRIASYQENHGYDCYAVVAKDKSEALITFIQVLGRANCHSRRIYLEGLDENRKYRIEGEERTYLGSTLMYAGLQIENLWGDFQGKIIYLKAEVDK